MEEEETKIVGVQRTGGRAEVENTQNSEKMCGFQGQDTLNLQL